MSGPSIQSIQKCVAEYYGIPVHEMMLSRRMRSISRCRMMAMYLCRTVTVYSYPFIAREFCKDHTTVMHAVEVITEILRRHPEMQADCDEMKRRINELPHDDRQANNALFLSVPMPKKVQLNGQR